MSKKLNQCVICEKKHSSKHSKTGKEQWYNHRKIMRDGEPAKLCKTCYCRIYQK